MKDEIQAALGALVMSGIQDVLAWELENPNPAEPASWHARLAGTASGDWIVSVMRADPLDESATVN